MAWGPQESVSYKGERRGWVWGWAHRLLKTCKDFYRLVWPCLPSVRRLQTAMNKTVGFASEAKERQLFRFEVFEKLVLYLKGCHCSSEKVLGHAFWQGVALSVVSQQLIKMTHAVRRSVLN